MGSPLSDPFPVHCVLISGLTSRLENLKKQVFTQQKKQSAANKSVSDLEMNQQELLSELESSIGGMDSRLAAGDTKLWDMDPLAEKLSTVADGWDLARHLHELETIMRGLDQVSPHMAGVENRLKESHETVQASVDAQNKSVEALDARHAHLIWMNFLLKSLILWLTRML